MSKSCKKKRQRQKNAILSVVRTPIFSLRSEKKLKGRGSYDRKQKHKGSEDCQRKIVA